MTGPITVSWEEVEGKLAPVVQTKAERLTATWSPQPGSQQAFLTCPVFECLYEGTRGPGKTDALLMDFAQHVGQGFGEAWSGILFRRTFPELQDVIKKSQSWFPLIFPQAKFNIQKSTWHFATGEKLRFSYMSKESDYWGYHGHQYPWVGWEELTTWADDKCYRRMMSTCRSSDPKVPRKYRATTNPYGIGHNWVKLRFGLPCPPDKIINTRIETEGEPDRVSIHGYLDENRVLLHADPEYKDRIRAAARNPAELAAWLDGSWDIIAGGMFDDIWKPKVHVLPNFIPPLGWHIDRSFDWGSAKPFSVGWWAVSDGSDLTLPDGRVMSTVNGDLFRFAEWYGWNGTPNEGLRMLSEQITKGIIEREIAMGIYNRVKPGPADTNIFNAEDGESIAHRMAQPVRVAGQVRRGISWAEADKRPGSRKHGWELMRERLKAAVPEEGKPRENRGMFVCQRCDQFIRTVPVLPRCEKDPDDVDTDAEDHIADEVRYRVRFSGKMARHRRMTGNY